MITKSTAPFKGLVLSSTYPKMIGTKAEKGKPVGLPKTGGQLVGIRSRGQKWSKKKHHMPKDNRVSWRC